MWLLGAVITLQGVSIQNMYSCMLFATLRNKSENLLPKLPSLQSSRVFFGSLFLSAFLQYCLFIPMALIYVHFSKTPLFPRQVRTTLSSLITFLQQEFSIFYVIHAKIEKKKAGGLAGSGKEQTHSYSSWMSPMRKYRPVNMEVMIWLWGWRLLLLMTKWIGP